jgi:hypothetical protein
MRAVGYPTDSKNSLENFGTQKIQKNEKDFLSFQDGNSYAYLLRRSKQRKQSFRAFKLLQVRISAEYRELKILCLFNSGRN